MACDAQNCQLQKRQRILLHILFRNVLSSVTEHQKGASHVPPVSLRVCYNYSVAFQLPSQETKYVKNVSHKIPKYMIFAEVKYLKIRALVIVHACMLSLRSDFLLLVDAPVPKGDWRRQLNVSLPAFYHMRLLLLLLLWLFRLVFLHRGQGGFLVQDLGSQTLHHREGKTDAYIENESERICEDVRTAYLRVCMCVRQSQFS